MPGIKELKTRIKSIAGTRKVTRAMQMVSAAKMRKAQDATLRSRTYSELAWELIWNLSGVIPASEPGSSNGDTDSGQLSDALVASGMTQLLQSYPQATKIAILILSTNRGLVGSLNANLLNSVQRIADSVQKEQPAGLNASSFTLHANTHIITYGRKGREWTVRSGKEVMADFEKFDRTITTEDIFPIAKLITDLYQTGKYQKVLIVYNHYVSTLVQQARVKQLLPFIETRGEGTGYRVEKNQAASKLTPHPSPLTPIDYLFEPTPSEVLGHLLPRIIESQIYQTILESEASEQSARMVMMKNATEAAGDLIGDLTLTYNKMRQNKITTELAEITAGKIALE